MKKVVIISTSLRPESNSEILAKAFAQGAEEAGNQVEFISLKGKKIAYCVGCFRCQEQGECIIKDDAIAIEKSVCDADVVVFSTPIYYYGISGQMKTLFDRMNSLYPKDYSFRDVYLLSTAAENEENTPKRTESGIMGWIECFEHAQLKGSIFAGGVNNPAEITGNPKLEEAREMGRNI